MELVQPDAKYKTSFIEAVKEFQAETENSFRHERYRKLSVTELEKDFDTFVARERSPSKGENLPEGYVPSTNLWLVEGTEFIGRVSIRHRLTDQLRAVGGHIGYDIRASMRGRGYGTAILKLALLKAKELGIDRALVTCDATNGASRKVIEKNGGVLEDQVPNPKTGVDKLRFWIDIP